MVLDTAFMAADFDEVASDIVQTITFGGQTYSCVAGIEESTNVLELAGLEGNGSLDVHVKLSDFGTAPGTGDKIAHVDITYRVDSYVDDAAGVARWLRCRQV